jgi:hypothetical protein
MSASQGAMISRSGAATYARIGGGSVIEFDAVLAQVLDLLQREGRVSYRALKLRFQLNDEYIEALKDEIIEVKQQAIDRDGRVLVWIGDPSTAPAPGAASPAAAHVASEDRPRQLPTAQLISREHQPTAQAGPTPQAASPAVGGNPPAAERRQLTVLFCDLVDSTRLAS